MIMQRPIDIRNESKGLGSYTNRDDPKETDKVLRAGSASRGRRGYTPIECSLHRQEAAESVFDTRKENVASIAEIAADDEASLLVAIAKLAQKPEVRDHHQRPEFCRDLIDSRAETASCRRDNLIVPDMTGAIDAVKHKASSVEDH